MTESLYTPSDVKRVRDSLLKEQGGKCAILGDIPEGRTVALDHNHFHQEQLVRAVLEREINAYCGIAENAYRRHLAYWVNEPIWVILRKVADYLEYHKDSPEKRYRHPAWRTKIRTAFNKLNAEHQNIVLESLLGKTGKNPAHRKKLFSEVTSDRKLCYTTIFQSIQQPQQQQYHQKEPS